MELDVAVNIGGANNEPYHGNPWAALDSPPPGNGLDCFSLTAIALAQVAQVGVDSAMAVAFPTSNGDASDEEKDDPATPTRWLRFYDHAQMVNAFEAFLVLNESGEPVEGHTLGPKNGPYLPVETGALAGLPTETWKRLAFTVIYWTLTNTLEAPPSFSGQQWWLNAAKVRVQGPEAIPVPNPLPANP